VTSSWSVILQPTYNVVAWQLLKLIFTAYCTDCNPSDLNRVEDISLEQIELVYFKITLYISLFFVSNNRLYDTIMTS